MDPASCYGCMGRGDMPPLESMPRRPAPRGDRAGAGPLTRRAWLVNPEGSGSVASVTVMRPHVCTTAGLEDSRSWSSLRLNRWMRATTHHPSCDQWYNTWCPESLGHTIGGGPSRREYLGV
ncbi:hypothetical protein EAI_04812 [Harpegnathos saltator]|uniref:Uncharacterized protein n=1 Tax=Harpegnathos saltator TaxID=610380 RepID=E2C6D4_HARSA|nr:hypothetical protein EAI_04812 [Harpegnathos saltator]